MSSIRARAGSVLCLIGISILRAGATAGAAQDAANAPDAGPKAATPRRIYETKRTEHPPKVDGRLDDSCWDAVPWATDFTEWEPDAGKPPSQQTRFKILYDNAALYIAYRAEDSDPARIASRLARRDWFPGDWVEINIDSRKDGRTGYSFTSSVSGTRGDEFISSDGDNWDGSWDPIWDLKTQVDSTGWAAEARIPLSQLRFKGAAEQTWGIQVQRRLFREEERSLWQPKTREETGWVSRFGELRGLTGLQAPRRIELFPYAVGRTERFTREPGNPFATGTDSKAAVGVDGKAGVLGDLTLDFTVNPDFGQVEADPSEVNLSAFETFFSEKRPFFIEGRNILNLQIAPSIAGGNFTQDNLFYSRRIGRRPAHFPDLGEGEFAQSPENSSILGAAKLTGKTAGGLSLGLLESATAREHAHVAGPGGRRDATVEPFTNYFVGRVQQDWRQGNDQLGAMVTSVNRRLDDPALEFLHRSAVAGGVDLFHRWNDRHWYLALNAMGSRVAGEPRALIATQRASARYFQRPDNTEATLDSTRTALAGHAGSFRFGHSQGQGLRFETGVAWRSPGFEINDIGFLRRADEVNQFGWAGYSIRKPFGAFRTLSINTNQWANWDFGGTLLSRQVNANSNAQFKNNWSMGIGGTHALGDVVSNTELRGGPAMRIPGTTDLNVWINSDSRKRVHGEIGTYVSWGDDQSQRLAEVWCGPTIQPSNALSISTHLNFTHNRDDLQYVTRADMAGSPRYLFGRLDQKTLSLSFRVDYTLLPNLTLQYYGAPFVSAGRYSRFRRITKPRAEAYDDRAHVFSGAEIAGSDASYAVDETGDGLPDYGFDNPDFNVRDFNSNLVARWEFQPGSLLYLVWSQARSGFVPNGLFSARQDLDALFDVQPHNVFLVKISKWFAL